MLLLAPLTGEDVTPEDTKKFKSWSNKALSMTVLSLKPELHYLIRNQSCLGVALNSGSNCSTCPRWKSYEMEALSMNKYLIPYHFLTKQVMFILAFFPDSFQTMVTALAASTEDIPSVADVKEKLRTEELRQKQNEHWSQEQGSKHWWQETQENNSHLPLLQ